MPPTYALAAMKPPSGQGAYARSAREEIFFLNYRPGKPIGRPISLCESRARLYRVIVSCLEKLPHTVVTAYGASRLAWMCPQQKSLPRPRCKPDVFRKRRFHYRTDHLKRQKLRPNFCAIVRPCRLPKRGIPQLPRTPIMRLSFFFDNVFSDFSAKDLFVSSCAARLPVLCVCSAAGCAMILAAKLALRQALEVAAARTARSYLRSQLCLCNAIRRRIGVSQLSHKKLRSQWCSELRC